MMSFWIYILPLNIASWLIFKIMSWARMVTFIYHSWYSLRYKSIFLTKPSMVNLLISFGKFEWNEWVSPWKKIHHWGLIGRMGIDIFARECCFSRFILWNLLSKLEIVRDYISKYSFRYSSNTGIWVCRL
jgi:hypothetical protein